MGREKVGEGESTLSAAIRDWDVGGVVVYSSCCFRMKNERDVWG